MGNSMGGMGGSMGSGPMGNSMGGMGTSMMGGSASFFPRIPGLVLNMSSLPSPSFALQDSLSTPAMMALQLPDTLGATPDMMAAMMHQAAIAQGGGLGSLFSPNGMLTGFTPRFTGLLQTSRVRVEECGW